MSLDRRPSRFGMAASGAFGLLSAVATALAASLGAVVSLVGLLLLVTGLVTASRRVVDAGGAGLLLGVLAAGYLGGAAEPLLAGALASVLGWDAAANACSVGEQLGRETPTARAEAVHLAGSLVAGALAVAVGYAVFAASAGGQPVAALFLLIVAAVALTSALR